MLIAAIVLAHLVGPERTRNAEIYSCAADHEQAATIYRYTKQLIQAEPALDAKQGGLLECIDSRKRITNPGLNSYYRALSSKSTTKHGMNPVVVIYDELAQAPNRQLYDVMITSFGARMGENEEPLFIVISTQSEDAASIMSECVDEVLDNNASENPDPTLVGWIFAVPDEADIYDEKNWHLANPALGDFRCLDEFRTMAEKAKRSAGFRQQFRNLYLNQRVDLTVPFIARERWEPRARHKAAIVDVNGNPVSTTDMTLEDFKGLPVGCGLDLSGKRDLTALGFAAPIPGCNHVFVDCKFYMPGLDNIELRDKEKLDRARYREWIDAGHIVQTQGPTVGLDFVAVDLQKTIADFDVQAIRYDAWRVEALQNELIRLGMEFDEKLFVKHHQGTFTMGPAIDLFEEWVLHSRLIHANNPVLNYCVANTVCTKDARENRAFDKRKSNRRIDGTVAVTMAVSAVNGFWKPMSETEIDFKVFFV